MQYLIPRSPAISDVLDVCLPADYILLLLSSTTEVPESSLNTLRSILGQGTSSVMAVVGNITEHDHVKTRTQIKKSLLSYITQYIPTIERVFASDDPSEASVVMRILCTGIPTGIRWREQRSYVFPEDWRWDDKEKMVVVSGTIRGKPLQVDRLIHIPSCGDFQIDKV
jgi:pre-rRNA-processing protein TSR1